MSEQEQYQESPENNDDEGFDFTHVNSVARIALYDNLLSAPRVTEIQPAPTGEFIESLATNVYQQSQAAGGTIPYTVIREVSENFIHARFQEATVSILDHGCTIRFADQGPGIACKDRAQLPGFTSAIEPMKSYIRGVGSGLPMVKEYLKFSNGRLVIEDNICDGAVVTIAVDPNAMSQPPVVYQESPVVSVPNQQAHYAQTPQQIQQGYVQAQSMQHAQQGMQAQQGMPGAWQQQQQMGQQPAFGQQPQMAAGMQQMGGMNQMPMGAAAQTPAYMTPAMQPAQGVSFLAEDEANILILATEGSIGPTDVATSLGVATTTAFRKLEKLEQAGYLMQDASHKGKRILTQLGQQVLREQV